MAGKRFQTTGPFFLLFFFILQTLEITENEVCKDLGGCLCEIPKKLVGHQSKLCKCGEKCKDLDNKFNSIVDPVCQKESQIPNECQPKPTLPNLLGDFRAEERKQEAKIKKISLKTYI